MSSQVAIVCPRCGQMDSVRKVTTIVTEGVSTSQIQGSTPVRWGGQTYWLPAQREASSVTMLAKRLLPPLEKPKGFAYRIFAALAGALFLGLIGFCALFATLSNPFAKEFEIIMGLLGGLGALCLAGILFVVFLIGLVSGSTKRRSSTEQQQYQRALAKWNELYYCYRDDIVFVPGQSGYASPERMREFLTQ